MKIFSKHLGYGRFAWKFLVLMNVRTALSHVAWTGHWFNQSQMEHETVSLSYCGSRSARWRYWSRMRDSLFGIALVKKYFL